MALDVWLGFFIASWIISLSPGAGALVSVTSGLNYGFKLGSWNVLGLQLALLVQILVVAAGLGAVLATSELAFNLIKWLGVIYLIYLGWRQWRAAVTPMADLAFASKQAYAKDVAGSLVLRGFLVNASNPKAIIFVLAVVPQFLDITAPLVSQYAVMTVTMVGVDVIVMLGYTGLAASLAPILDSPRYQSWRNKVFGITFILAAVLMAGMQQG